MTTTGHTSRAALNPDALCDLVGAIYDAAFDLAKWPAAMAGVANILGGHRALMFVPNMGGREFWASHELSPSMMSGYWQYYHCVDIWVARSGKFLTGTGATVVSEMIVPEAEYSRTEIWNDFCRPLDIFRVACAAIEIPARMPGAGTLLSIYRSRNSKPFDPVARDLLHTIQPHVSRSLRLGRLMASQASERCYLQAMLAAVRKPLIAVNADAHVIYANPAAEALLRECDGLTAVGNRLTAATRALTNKLVGTIARSAQVRDPELRAGATLRLPRPLSGTELIIDILSVPSSVQAAPLNTSTRVLLAIHSPAKMTEEAGSRFREAYGLTPSEWKLVRELLSAREMRNVALRLGIRHSTARTQLKAVFAKTQTHRQIDLIHLAQTFMH